MLEHPAQEVVGHGRQIQPALVGLVFKQVALAIAHGHVHVHAIARAVAEGLGHEGADQPHVVGDLGGGHLEADELVGRGQAVAVGVVDLELAVAVFMVDLVHVEPGADGRGHQPVHVLAGTGQGFVVVAGFLQGVAGVAGHDIALCVTAQNRELGFQAGEESQAFFLEQGHLLFQHHAAVVFPGFAVHMAVADDAGKAGLPGNQAHGTEVTARHEVGSVRLDTQAPDRKARKARAGVQHLIKV